MSFSTFISRHVTDQTKIGPMLVSVYGIGMRSAFRICLFLGLGYSQSVFKVGEEKLAFIEDFFAQIPLDSDLQRIVEASITSKFKSGSFAGLRLSQGLPARGQRTKTNAMTSKRLFKGARF